MKKSNFTELVTIFAATNVYIGRCLNLHLSVLLGFEKVKKIIPLSKIVRQDLLIRYVL